MSLFGIFASKKEEVLKTEALRRKTKREITESNAVVDKQYQHLSKLVDETLRELGNGTKLLTHHPNEKQG